MQLFELGVFLTLLALGFFAGRVIEARHYTSIRTRERALQDVLAFAARFPPDRITPQHAFLVTGTVVVSADYFKTFVALCNGKKIVEGVKQKMRIELVF